jgi:hypothetical protein
MPNNELIKVDGTGLDNEVVAAQLRVCAAEGASEHSHSATHTSRARRPCSPVASGLTFDAHLAAAPRCPFLALALSALGVRFAGEGGGSHSPDPWHLIEQGREMGAQAEEVTPETPVAEEFSAGVRLLLLSLLLLMTGHIESAWWTCCREVVSRLRSFSRTPL